MIGSVIGAVITAVSGSAATRRAERRADHERARDLLSQVVNAAAQLETEKLVFRERRDSWRPNLHATGQIVIELLAARQDGNWLRGAADGIRALREWDADEGGRFTERMQAAAAQVTPSLVSLSLMSPQLQAAAAHMADALAGAARAHGRDKQQAANTELSAAVAGLRAAVYEFTTPQQRRWRPGG